MGADILFVNFSLVAAFVLWFFYYVEILHTKQPAALAHQFRDYVLGYASIWTMMALLIFHLHGFYTRTRGYVRSYKALIILRAVSILVISFVFLDYFLYRGQLFPRGVALLSWILLLMIVGGSRFAKYRFLEHYDVSPKHASTRIERVLVVGGAGYLGSELVPMLLERGYGVRVIDSLLFGVQSLKSVINHPKFELLRGDVRDIQMVVHATKGVDAVIDLAAIVGDPACAENPQLAAETNRAATRMLVDVCRGHGTQRFLFASTCSVYGASELLMDEHSQVAPISLYAQTKLDSESILLGARTSEFHPTILRLATLFGASKRLRFDLVVNLLTMRAICLGKITIFNGEQWRPFMHVRDAARALLTCLETSNIDVVSGEIFNAGSSTLNHRLSEIAELISKVVPTVSVEHVDNDDRRNYRVSFEKIHRRLKFECEQSLEQGIKELAEIVRNSPVENFSADVFNNRAMVKVFAQTDDSKRSSFRVLEELSRAASAK